MSRTLSWIRLIILITILAALIWAATGGLDTWWIGAKHGVQGGVEAIIRSLISFSILALVVAGTGYVISPAGRMGMAITALLLVVGTGNLIHAHVDSFGNYGNAVWVFHFLVTLPLAVLSGFWMVASNSVGEGFSKGLTTYLYSWKEFFALIMGIINVFRVTDPVVRALNKQRRGRF